MISASLESTITSVLPPGAGGHSLRKLAHRVRAFSAALGLHWVGRYLNISIFGLQAHKAVLQLLVEVSEGSLALGVEQRQLLWAGAFSAVAVSRPTKLIYFGSLLLALALHSTSIDY